MIGQGIFTPLFKTLMACDIPSYYKIFLTAYLCSYASGGAYLIVFSAAAITRIVDSAENIDSLYAFSPAGIIILNFVIYYVVGYITFLISLVRMHAINKNLLFPEYRKRACGALYLIFVKLRYCLTFQFLFYSVATLTFYFLGSMDHLLSRPNICSATNKDSINIGRCEAFMDTVRFNSGSWCIAFIVGALAYATVLQEEDWDPTSMPEDILNHALFAGPALLLSVVCFVVPIIRNPHILGWPFWRKRKPKKFIPESPRPKRTKKDALGREIVDIRTFMDKARESLEDEIVKRKQNTPDVEIGSLGTNCRDLRSAGSPRSPYAQRKTLDKARIEASPDRPLLASLSSSQYNARSSSRMHSIPESASSAHSRLKKGDDDMQSRRKSPEKEPALTRVCLLFRTVAELYRTKDSACLSLLLCVTAPRLSIS